MIENYRSWFGKAACVVGLALSAAPVLADIVGENSPLDLASGRANGADVETAGVRVGALRLFPKAAVTLVHDSNVFASNLARDAAVLTISEAQLHVRNDPGAFALSGEGFVRDRQYTQLHDQDTTEYGATAAATSSIDARNELTARVAAQRRFESRIEIETPDGRYALTGSEDKTLRLWLLKE